MIQVAGEHRAFGGVQGFYSHESKEIGLPMRFSVYRPPQALSGPVPALLFLAGLTCTEETFMIKAGAQRWAAELGIALIAPDTSPRGTGIEGADKDWDFGHGAGFYLDATESPWARHFRMESWITRELLPLVTAEFNLRADGIGISGHSMGGHGALTLALQHPGLFKSVSALAPIAAPTQCPWGEEAFSGYLGSDRSTWAAHDACELIRKAGNVFPQGILVDQGLADKFLVEQLKPELFEAACGSVGQPLTLRRHADYDHSYWFVSSFIADHLRFHHSQLTRP
jgi:S-formylglutathione hydrolase